MQQKQIAVIVGSLRAGSYARMLSKALIALAPSSMQLAHVEIGALPHYDQDLETSTPPPAWTEFRNRINSADAVLFATPEYNRSIPGVLKNAVDVGSRPWGKSAWNGKPAAVIGISPGAMGAMAANLHLRQVLYAVNMTVMTYPEAYLPNAASFFDKDGQLTNADTRQFLVGYMRSFEAWLQKA
jgi:chromate reductase